VAKLAGSIVDATSGEQMAARAHMLTPEGKFASPPDPFLKLGPGQPFFYADGTFEMAALHKEPVPVEYNSDVPVETLEVIVTDECHRSIYNVWMQVLEYFVGITATPSKQTIGFFNQNLVMECNHEQAVLRDTPALVLGTPS
jgi:hypothetical protein